MIRKNIAIIRGDGLILSENSIPRCSEAGLLISLLLSVFFSLISCNLNNVDGNKDNDFGSGILGKSINLKGQVFEIISEGKYEKWSYDDDVEIYSSLGGSGEIKRNGQFSFNINTPNQYAPFFEWGWVYDDMEELNNFQINPVSAQMALFDSLYVSFNSSFFGMLEKTANTHNEDILEHIFFIFVDQDVTVSADKTIYTEQHTGGEIGKPPTVFYTNYIVNAFEHSLKAGWNIVYVRSIFEGNSTYKKTFLHANPNNWKWIFSRIYY